MQRTYQWNEPSELIIPTELFDLVEHPLVAELLVRRGITDGQTALAFLDPQAYTPSNPMDFTDLPRAAERIRTALQKHERIGVWGDFDVDGQTATAVLVSALKRLGADVIYHLPVRRLESHGMRRPALSRFLDLGVQLLITCDSGISEIESIDYVKSRGVDCIITDHHLPSTEIPAALAVINPHLLPPNHPSASLSGVGVAYCFAQGVYNYLKSSATLDDLLDLVALGSIADVATLTSDIRYYTQLGLLRMRGDPRPALSALFEKADVDSLTLDEDDISRQIAPRLNAVGRVKDANELVEFLLCENLEDARIAAARYEQIHLERKLKIDQCAQAVEKQIDSDRSLAHSPALVLSNPAWDAGVLSTVASRISDQYNRPVIILSAPSEGIARGSARAPSGIDLLQLLKEHSHLLSDVFGHASAAGVALPQENIAALRAALNKSAARFTGDEPAPNPLFIDSEQPLSLFDLDLVQHIQQLAPFGKGNPAPVFLARNMKIKDVRKIGKQDEHLRLQLQDEHGEEFTVLKWNSGIEKMPRESIDLAYTVRIHRYREEIGVQYSWMDARANLESVIDAGVTRAAIEILDYRGAPDPQAVLDSLPPGEFVVWAEGKISSDQVTSHRLQAAPAKTLVVWSIPPGAGELQQVIQKVKPQRVLLLAEQTSPADFQSFLVMLTGLVKTVLNKKRGILSIHELAALCGHRPTTIKAGLQWLHSAGKISIIRQDEDEWFIIFGGNSSNTLSEDEKRLRILLDETAAYRQWYRTAEPDQIIQSNWLNT